MQLNAIQSKPWFDPASRQIVLQYSQLIRDHRLECSPLRGGRNKQNSQNRLTEKSAKAEYHTRGSQAVSDPSTNRALCCLTCEIWRGRVCSAWYGGIRTIDVERCSYARRGDIDCGWRWWQILQDSLLFDGLIAARLGSRHQRVEILLTNMINWLIK